MRKALRLLLPAICVALVSCQAGPTVAPSTQFHLGPEAKGATTHGGTVTINLASLLHALRAAGKYRVLATAADVDHLTITLSMPGQPNLVQVVTATQITNGQSSVTFAGLPTGTVTIAVVAYDVYGNAIGSATQAASITNGQNSSVNMNVPIDPSASPASASSDTVGLTASFTASPSPPPAGTVVATFANCACFYADNVGRFYGETLMPVMPWHQVRLTAYSVADGAKVAQAVVEVIYYSTFLDWTVPIAYNPVSNAVDYVGTGVAGISSNNGMTFDSVAQITADHPIALDSAGNVFFDGGTGVIQEFASGTPQPTSIPLNRSFTIDANGDFWSDESSSATSTPCVAKYSAAGSLLGTYPLSFSPLAIKPDKSGDVWVSDGWGLFTGTSLVKVSSSGLVGTRVALSVDGFCLDANDNLWVATGTSLVELDANGATLATYPIAAKNVAFGNGYILADIGGAVDKIQP